MKGRKGRPYWVWAALLALGLGAYATEAPAQPVPIAACGVSSACGFTSTICAAGSYVLTGPLMAAGDCITIAAADVTIDFQGFTMMGNGTGEAIKPALGTSPTNIVIRNGTIQSFGLGGIILPNSSAVRVEGMQVISNGGIGIEVGTSSTVRDNIVTGNVLTGIDVTCPSNLIGNTAQGNNPNVPKNLRGCTLANNLF